MQERKIKRVFFTKEPSRESFSLLNFLTHPSNPKKGSVDVLIMQKEEFMNGE